MSKKELYQIINKGVAFEISSALLQYYKEINFYKRQDAYSVAEKLFKDNR